MKLTLFLIAVTLAVSQAAESALRGESERQLSKEDLNIRFSKVYFPGDDIPSYAVFPMTAAQYPVDLDVFRWLRYSRAYSVTIHEACVECDIPVTELAEILSLTAPATHPNVNEDHPYWAELQEVVDIQHKRLEGAEPSSLMPLPDLWMDMTIGEIAEAVHDEFPGIHHVNLIIDMAKRHGINLDYNVIPFCSDKEFIRGMVMLSDLTTWSIARVGPHNFGLKYFAGRARPEEVAWIINGDLIPHGPPAALVDSIKALNLTSAASFTMYPEGSPTHPSYPAMHSAGSAASFWMAVVLDLTDEQWCQIKLTDYTVSFARTIAGVHYVSDNLAGLALGQEIMARKLPEYLSKNYGSVPERVMKKIESMRFDWKDFLDSDCAKGLL